jgi:hypothetical protein
MADYMLLIYDDEAAWETAGPERTSDVMSAHEAFMAKHRAALRGGNRLTPSYAATSIRTGVDGAVSVTDGAFVESKEVLGGYYLIEASDLDHALRIACDVPAPFGGVEVRPIWPTS